MYSYFPVYSCTKTNESLGVVPRADRTVMQSHRPVPCNPFDHDKSQEDNPEISNARESQELLDITKWL